MTEATDAKNDFFVSFNKADRQWAAWIAWTLEAAGHTVVFQDWDFTGNFVLEMQRGLERTRRMIMVLSPEYLASLFTAPEWAARFAEDPDSAKDLLVPFRVTPCEPKALLSTIVYTDLMGTSRDEARERVLKRVSGRRRKPDEEPSFPGGSAPAVATKPDRLEPRFPTPARNNLLPPNPDFVGREGPLADLRALLTANEGPAVLTQAITGLGGIGKTQTARAYAWRHLADYRLIWWVQAETAVQLAADYAALAGPLGLDPSTDQPRLIAAVRDALPAHAPCLLVFDNVEDPALPRAYFPAAGAHVLITSRRTDWQGIARPLPLRPMPEDEALALLTGGALEKLPAADLAAAKALAADLGYLPLALAQAAAYLAETPETFASYRELLRASPAAALAEGNAGADYPAPVARTWDLSVRAAEAQCAPARPLLEILAFFAPEAIPPALLDADADALPKELRDRLARNRAFAALARFSLVNREGEDIAVHRLVQAVTRERLTADLATTRVKCAIRLANVGWPKVTWDHAGWSAMEKRVPHAIAAATAAAHYVPSVRATSHVLDRAATFLQVRGTYTQAGPLFEQAVAAGERALGPDHPHLATRLNNLSTLYQDTGRPTEAEQLLLRALAIREKALGPDYPDTGQSLNNLALLYQDTGRPTEAEPLLLRALAIREKALGPDHPDTGQSLNNLAGLYRYTGRLDEAEPLVLRAVAITEKALGPDHPTFAIRLNNLAGLYQDTGRPDEAEPLYLRAVAITEKTLGPDHPDTGQSLNNLAGLYRDTGRPDEAEPLYLRAVAITEKTLGPDHPTFAISLNNLANLYQDTGRLAEAEPLLLRAVAIGERALGPDHPDLAISLNNLAALYRANGRLAEAEPLLLRAVAIIERGLPADHPYLAVVLRNYAHLLDDLGRPDEAAALRARADATGR